MRKASNSDGKGDDTGELREGELGDDKDAVGAAVSNPSLRWLRDAVVAGCVAAQLVVVASIVLREERIDEFVKTEEDGLTERFRV
ncbi:hypothetical protein AHAS_Ahas10G0106000 [Arachis hypogaea]